MIQVQLPDEIAQYLSEIRSVRALKCEPLTTKAIVIDAVKDMHAKIKEQQ